MSTFAVLTAAGSGSRLGSQGPKALVELLGKPLVLWAAQALACGGVQGIVVTAPDGHIPQFQAFFPYGTVPNTDVAVDVVQGSDLSRQASVARGLEAIESLAARIGLPLTASSHVLVHDAARPLASDELIGRIIKTLVSGAQAVIPGLPVTDTIKQVGPATNSFADSLECRQVHSTPDRSQLVSVQTPQGFTWALLRDAHAAGAARALDEGQAFTDDAALVEAYGGTVFAIAGESRALKITNQLDLAVAEIVANL